MFIYLLSEFQKSVKSRQMVVNIGATQVEHEETKLVEKLLSKNTTEQLLKVPLKD